MKHFGEIAATTSDSEGRKEGRLDGRKNEKSVVVVFFSVIDRSVDRRSLSFLFSVSFVKCCLGRGHARSALIVIVNGL